MNEKITKENLDPEQLLPATFEVSEDDSDQLSILTEDKGQELSQSIDMISDMYLGLGKKYGIKTKFDISSVAKNFQSIADPRDKRLFELYLSEGFSRFRLTVIQKLMVSITTLVDRITQKDILESDNIELSVGLLDKLFLYMDQINKLAAEMKIDSSDLELRQAAVSLKEDPSSDGTKAGADNLMVLRLLRGEKLKDSSD